MADDPKTIYSIKELILWLEDPHQNWQGKRPLQYAAHARKELRAAQRRLYLTAFGVGGLAFFAGFGVCWFVFVR